MQITRDGAVIKLTDNELETAFRERLHAYRMEDIRGKLESMYEDITINPDVDSDIVSKLASIAENKLDKNDSYYEAYWDSVEAAISEYFNER